MAATRDAGFGDEVKRRIILGTYALSAGYYDAYYGSAQKVRTLIQRDFDDAFAQVDVIATPSAPTTAFRLGEKIDDPMQMYLNDVTTIPANLAGVPGISIPSGLAEEDGLPVGIQFLAPARAGRATVPGRRGARGAARRSWGGPLLDRAPRSTEEVALMAKDKLMDFDKALELFEPVLGFEVHVELNTKTKMFSARAELRSVASRTRDLAPVDLGLPGSLPVVNEQAVRYSISLGLALGCQIAPSSRFARKNYFYPDLGKNYQISQYDEPIAFEGSVEVELADGTRVVVPIERAHMEEDAGKLTHVGGSTGRIQGAEYSLVDYNRAGVPLVEIVTKPIYGTEHRAPEIAKAYVQTIRDIVLVPGHLRRAHGARQPPLRRERLAAPAAGQEKLGTRTETKNVNSMRSVERAVRYEIQRQAAILAAGGTITQETRHWHEDTGTTSPGRPKSDADDYRYFPEPDLLPVVPSAELIEELRAALPEPPAERRRRLKTEWGFSDLEFQDVANGGLLAEVDATDRGRRDARRRTQVVDRARSRRIANAQGREASDLVSPGGRRGAAGAVDAGTLTDKLARQVLEGVIRARGLRRRSSTRAVSPSSRTTARSSRRSTRHSPRSPTCSRRSATARCRLPVRSSVRS